MSPQTTPPQIPAPRTGAPAEVGDDLPLGSLRRFEKLIDNDLGHIGLNRFVASRKAAVAAARPRELQVLSIATSHLNACLAQNCRLRPMSAQLGLEDMTERAARADFLLVETAWACEDRAWAPVLRDCDGSASRRFRSLLEECRQRGVPTVLWMTLDRTHFDIFAHLAPLFTHVFAADAEVLRRLKVDGIEATHLPPAVEPTMHNPLFSHEVGQQFVRKDFGICSDSYHELCAFDRDSVVPELLTPALDYTFWLFETRFLMRNNNARLAKDFRRRFLGCFDDDARTTMLKNSEYYIPATPRPDVPRHDMTRNMLEAMAQKTLVLSNAAPFLEAVDPFFARAENADEMRAQLARFVTSPHLRRMTQHLAYREVMSRHTYADRLRTICATLGIAGERMAPEAPPLITAMMPTMRPELLPFALSGYRRHAHPNLELVIVLHSDSYSPEDVAPLLRAEDHARVIRVPEDQSVGTALNAGIDAARGKYWARIDDDDYYGPHYFTDAMLNRKFHDFDVCGKSQWFIYFEALAGAYVHKKDWAAHSLNPVLAGGTFLVRNTGTDRLRFDDRVRGYADIDLLGREIDRGDCNVVSSDPFNFLQIRRMDRRSHTWTADASQIRTSEKITDGMNLSRIGI